MMKKHCYTKKLSLNIKIIKIVCKNLLNTKKNFKKSKKFLITFFYFSYNESSLLNSFIQKKSFQNQKKRFRKNDYRTDSLLHGFFLKMFLSFCFILFQMLLLFKYCFLIFSSIKNH